MSLTLAELRSRVYFLADERPSGLFPSAAIDDLINSGLYIVAQEAGIPYSTAVLTTVVGQPAYTLEEPILAGGVVEAKTVSFEDVDLTFSQRLSSLSSSNGTPTKYTVTDEGVYLDPAPSTEGTLVVSYRRAPYRLTADSDTSTASHDAQELACIYAVYQMKLKDDELSVADRWKARFDQGVSRLAGPRPGVYKP